MRRREGVIVGLATWADYSSDSARVLPDRRCEASGTQTLFGAALPLPDLRRDRAPESLRS